jgi:predicted RNA-binding protein YlxR (DUF448 family)
MRRKHVPQRTCVGCRQVWPKRELLRIARSPDSRVTVDESGKRAGRGAYLCRKRSCWEAGLLKGRLEHALGVRLSAEERAALEEFARTLPADDGLQVD